MSTANRVSRVPSEYTTGTQWQREENDAVPESIQSIRAPLTVPGRSQGMSITQNAVVKYLMLPPRLTPYSRFRLGTLAPPAYIDPSAPRKVDELVLPMSDRATHTGPVTDGFMDPVRGP